MEGGVFCTRGVLLTLVLLLVSACTTVTPFVHLELKTLEPVRGQFRYRLILVGDAGEPKVPEPVLDTVEAWAREQPDRTTVVFLGDNVYPRGLVPKHAARAKEILVRQLEVKDSGATVVFVPGNHDWDHSGRDGLEAVKAQAAFVEGPNTSLMPTAGCPGPEHRDLPKDDAVVRLVTLDTHWWLHSHATGSGCMPGTKNAVVEELRKLLTTDLPVVLTAHHPLATHGPHGGYHPLSEGLVLPVYGFLRRLVRHNQDVFGPRNREMVRRFDGVMLESRRQALTIFAAGHEHGLQVLKGRAADYVLVSGAGASDHTNPVGRGPDTLYGHSGSGFMVLDVRDDGALLAVVEVSAASTEQRWYRLVK
jgi:hypothetical protein